MIPLKKAEEFKQGHFNLVQHFLKKECKITVYDRFSDNCLIEKSDNYEDIKKVIKDDETEIVIYDNEEKRLSWVWVIPYNEGIDTIADYSVSKSVDNWADKFEKTMEELN